MPELKPLPCPECGKDAQVIKIERNNNKPPVFVCLCQNHPCTDREAVYVSPEAAIAAWDALPRMSALIAWQFQAAGLALALQRQIEMGEALRNAQWMASVDRRFVPSANEVGEEFDAALVIASKALEVRHG